MGFRFRQQLKIAPGLKLNLSRRGISSLSIGGRGLTANVGGKRGAMVTASVPGTGISYSERIGSGKARKASSANGVVGALFIIALVVWLLFIGTAQAGGLYKCTDAAGIATYSQSPCPGVESNEIRVSTAISTPVATDDELIKRCVNAAEWKDPESVKVLAHGTMGAEVITYAGTKIVANVIPIRVNAHNSYGGYTGPEWRYCYLSQNDKQVLAIR